MLFLWYVLRVSSGLVVPAAKFGLVLDLLEFACVFDIGRGFLLKEVHCPGLSVDGRVGGGAKGFDQELELCSDQPIIVCVIYGDNVCERK